MSKLLDSLAPWPEDDFARYGEIETRKLTKIQRLVGAFLGRNWVAIPHVTHHDEADVSDMEQRRQVRNAKGGVKITPVALLVRAMALALARFPQFNVSLLPESGSLVVKKYINIGVAVDTPGGLLVPVLRGCDTKDLDQVASELSTLSDKARTKGLSLDEMSGGSMTLTSLGHIGGTGFTPIVNAPEVAILGVTRARSVAKPSPDGGVIWKQMLPLSLSYDHRVINGADAARFTRFLAENLADPALFD